MSAALPTAPACKASNDTVYWNQATRRVKEDVSYPAAKSSGQSAYPKAATQQVGTPKAQAPPAPKAVAKSKRVVPGALPVGRLAASSSAQAAGSSNEVSPLPAATLQVLTSSEVGFEVQQPALSRSLARSQEELDGPWTTAVIRNIPARISQAQLQDLWLSEGSYNFLYLPYSQTTHRTVGFVLVNFVSASARRGFQTLWHGGSLIPDAKVKPLDVAMADLQGLEANLLQMRRTNKMNRLKHMKHVPIIINPDGSFADFKVLMQSIQPNAAGGVDGQEYVSGGTDISRSAFASEGTNATGSTEQEQ